MTDRDRITFWGSLDVAARTMEDIPEPFQELWDEGHFRMRAEDIKRLRVYLLRIHRADRKISAIIKCFDTIAK